MKHKKNKTRAGILAVILVLAAAVIFFAKLYPIALVGGNFVPLKVWEQDWALAQKLDPSSTKQQVFDQFILNQKKAQLVSNLRLADNNSFQDEWVFYKTGNEAAYNKLISDYFSGDENLFEENVVQPQALDALLRVKYNSNFAANNDAYNKAENILTKLSQGQSFDDLALQYSDDKVSGQLGGDIGFVSANQVLPELKKTIQGAKLGEVNKQVIVSRQGYHILFPVEQSDNNGQKLYHIKQILIQTTGYDDWLSQQLQTIGTHQLMKI
ncbi:MAG: peptidylprolyl isomerase [Candidatus Paceibacterales bacterium]